MWEKEIIVYLTRKHKWILLLVFWTISVAALALLSLHNSPFQPMVDDFSQYNLTKNEIGPISYVYCDPQNNLRPEYSFSFNNLWFENSELGIFKTASHKRLKIEGLSLRLYSYDETDRSDPLNSLAFANKKANARALVGEILPRFINSYNGWHINDLNLGYISEIRINDLNYKVLYKDGSYFNIKSKRMSASYKQPEILFYGHVIIETPDGDILETNRVKLDIKKKHFIVDGVYVLNRKGTKTAGRGICVDTCLNDVNTQVSQNHVEDDKKCLAKL